MSHAEYEENVGELNKQFHETAESMILSTPAMEGVIPLDPDEDETPDLGRKQKKARRSR